MLEALCIWNATALQVERPVRARAGSALRQRMLQRMRLHQGALKRRASFKAGTCS